MSKFNRYVFLNIDVLLHKDEEGMLRKKVNGTKIEWVKMLLKATQSELIIYSDRMKHSEDLQPVGNWEKEDKWQDMLKEAGWNFDRIPVKDRTPITVHGIAGLEIAQWLNENASESYNYIILDLYNNHLLWDLPRFIQINKNTGLEYADIQKASHILNGRPRNLSFTLSGLKVKASVKVIGGGK